MLKLKFYLVAILISIYLLFAQTWSPPKRVSPYVTGLYIILGQGLTADNFGTPWCGWVVHQYSPYQNVIYVSHYSDTAWSDPDTIYPFGGFTNCNLATDANGNVWVVAEEGSSAISACFYDGNSWSDLMSVPTPGSCCHYPVATGDSLGNLWVCWASRVPGDGHHIWGNAYIAGQWGSPVLISYPGSQDEFAYSMTTDEQGNVWVGWFTTSWPDFEAICVSFYDSSGWSDSLLIAEYSPANRFALLGPALTIDTAGMVWAGWCVCDHEDTICSVYASYYDGNTWSAPMFVASEPAVFYSEIAITSDNAGMVWLTWTNPDTNICYSYWNGTNWSNPAPVDTHPAADGDPAMTFDGERIWVTWIREIGSNTYGVYASYTYGVGVEEKQTADSFLSVSGLSQNYPNPFKKITEIRYQIPKEVNSRQKSVVSIELYDVTGRLVRTLVNEPQEPGYYNVSWDGKDDLDNAVPSGIYFYRIEAGNFTAMKKIVKTR